MQTPSPQISALHARYCELIGDPSFALTLPRIFAWDEWLHYPRQFTMADLELVIEHIKRKIKERKFSTWNYSFRCLVEHPDQFEEWLVEAKAEKRNQKKPVTPKERVIQQARPTVAEQPAPATARSVGELLKQMRIAAQ